MRSFPLLIVTSVALASCGGEPPVGPRSAPAILSIANHSVLSAAQAPVEFPFLLVFEDINPCTGATIVLTFEGTRRVHAFDGHRVVHISGTVTTSDGYVGVFNRQLVFQGGRVENFRFFDMEVGPDHDRQLFTGNIHFTYDADDNVIAEVLNATLRCVGKP